MENFVVLSSVDTPIVHPASAMGKPGANATRRDVAGAGRATVVKPSARYDGGVIEAVRNKLREWRLDGRLSKLAPGAYVRLGHIGPEPLLSSGQRSCDSTFDALPHNPRGPGPVRSAPDRPRVSGNRIFESVSC